MFQEIWLLSAYCGLQQQKEINNASKSENIYDFNRNLLEFYEINQMIIYLFINILL
jgi:hypothetical protein